MQEVIAEIISTIVSLAVGGLAGYVIAYVTGQPHNNMPPCYVLAYIMRL